MKKEKILTETFHSTVNKPKKMGRAKCFLHCVFEISAVVLKVDNMIIHCIHNLSLMEEGVEPPHTLPKPPTEDIPQIDLQAVTLSSMPSAQKLFSDTKTMSSSLRP